MVWQTSCQRLHMFVCMVLTTCFFASLVCFGSFKNLVLSDFTRDWCCFPSKRLPCIHINLLVSVLFEIVGLMFALIPLFFDFARYLTLCCHMLIPLFFDFVRYLTLCCHMIHNRFSHISLLTVLCVVKYCMYATVTMV